MGTQAGQKEARLYWGWYVVGGAFLVMTINYGARYCFGIFINPLSLEYNWSRSVISGAASLMIITYGVGGIFTGRLLDRMAPRTMIMIGVAVSAAGFILTSFITSPWKFYLVYGILCGAGTSCFGVVVCSTSVGKWFVKKRGLTIGIASMGIGFGTMILAPLVGYIVKEYGWRMGFISLGIMVLLIGESIALLVMGKTKPEDYGMLPDGEQPRRHPEATEGVSPLPAGSLRPVLVDSRFWILVAAFGLAVTVEMMAFMHQVAYAIDNNIEKVAAAASVGLVGIASILGRFFFGWLSDRLRDAKYSASLGFLFMVVGIVVLMHARTPAVLFGYAMLFGFGYGSMAPMMPVLLADRFGRHVLGASYGMLIFFITIGGGLGPLLGGLIYDHLGGYEVAWRMGIAALVAVTFLILLLKPRAESPAAVPRS
jgi:sugar phosphate permease